MIPWWFGVVLFVIGAYIGLMAYAMLSANNDNMKGDEDHGQRNQK